ncbi:hypothetical protein G9A89_003186 [Geosiphon pyriformis]|nr:hypothetical protein G9A89_003186 [Geosiphon pyriformis]
MELDEMPTWSNYKVKSQFLFVFDKARILNEKNGQTWSNFECLQYVMKTLPVNSDGKRVFCVFLDTTSKIHNFSSFRLQKKGCKLFLLFTEIAFVNFSATDLSQTLAESALLQHFFKFGRPLWTALHRSGHFKPAAIISFARSKLIGGMDYNGWLNKKNGEWINNLECLAIFSPRLCLDIVSQSKLASTLTLSYMRPCFYINDTRTTIMTGCISETILTKASVQITGKSEEVGLIRVLNPLINMIKERLVKKGY